MTTSPDIVTTLAHDYFTNLETMKSAIMTVEVFHGGNDSVVVWITGQGFL